MKARTLELMLVIALAMIPALARSDTWSRGLTVNSVGAIEQNGELVIFTVNSTVDNAARCQIGTEYAIRNKETIRSALALLMSSLVAQRTVDILVTGSCDTSGRPLVDGVMLR
jgi:hypothetical protein